MFLRCVYCGMKLDASPLKARIEGEDLTFCSQRCLTLFGDLGRTGKVKARIQLERFDILERLETKRGSRVLTLVHRKEPWSKEDGFISIEDSELLVAQIRRTPPEKHIDLIIHTPGGIVIAAEMIAMAVRNHPGKVTAIVPFYAMSGGTMIALAAHELMMDEESILGPLDPQISGYPSQSLITLPARTPIETISDQMVILSETAQKSVSQVRAFVSLLLVDKLPPAKREKVASFLTGGYVTHDTPIVPAVLREIGLKIVEDIPEEVYELFRTYEFGSCARPQCAAY